MVAQFRRHTLHQKTPNQTATEVTIEAASTPPGADIELDGSFVYSTPSSVSVSLGEHTVKLIKISPDLESVGPTPGK
jgi:hypothetical protein